MIRNDGRAIEALVARGTDPNTPDANGQLALTRALLAESYGAAEALARLPATDVNRRNRAGETALMLAALKGHQGLFRQLLERGAQPDADGWAPLHYAAAGDQLAFARQLLALRVRVDARAPNGRTPLMMAAAFGGEAMAEELLAAGADQALSDQAGHRAADFARQSGRPWLAERIDRPRR